jgi:hypothetical protein
MMSAFQDETAYGKVEITENQAQRRLDDHAANILEQRDLPVSSDRLW